MRAPLTLNLLDFFFVGQQVHPLPVVTRLMHIQLSSHIRLDN